MDSDGYCEAVAVVDVEERKRKLSQVVGVAAVFIAAADARDHSRFPQVSLFWAHGPRAS